MTFRSLPALSLLSVLALSLLLLAGAHPKLTHADAATDIQAQISSHNQQISDLEKEIAQYQQQLNVVSGQKQTLESQIKSLDISRQKITAQISLTKSKIEATNLELSRLALGIMDKSTAINFDQKAVANSMRNLQTVEDSSLIEQLLSSGTLADGWTTVDSIATMNRSLQDNAAGLTSDRAVLTDRQTAVNDNKQKLVDLNNQLASQQGELDANRKAKEQLLGQTKAQVSSFQSIIATKRAQQKAFESELSSLQSQLKSIGQGAAPKASGGILAWPFSAAFAQSCLGKASALGNTHCITQYFGTTPFSTANPQVYNGNGHNAIDIGMPTGTPVLAALGGTVLGTGNTDAIPGCYSFGKWVMVKHANGLATLYAHLSSIGVSTGQSVSTGSQVGYSGMTGYATGPHLHFGVYASAGVKIMTLGQYRGATTPCANATMPVAPTDAYLNPMSYL